MTFRKFDSGEGKREKGSKGDCQVRALTTATGMPYDAAWGLLYRIQGELKHCAFTIVHSLTAGDPRLGVKRSLPFPAVKGKPRMTGAEFCRKHPKGRYILRMAHHVVAVKDGVLFDTGDTSRACVYTAWEVDPAPVHTCGKDQGRQSGLSRMDCDACGRGI